MAKYEPTTAYEVFGTYMTVGAVEERVPLILCDGGSKDDWVYDAHRATRGTTLDGEEIRYRYRGLGILPDGRVVRVYSFIV